MSKPGELTVHVINPRKKKSAKKKTGAKKMAAKKKSGKKSTKKRSHTPAPVAKRHKNPAPKKKKKRRRKNPAGFGGALSVTTLIGEAKSALPRVAGMLAVAWAVKKWGGTGSLFGTGLTTSEFAGTSWTWRQYGIALAVATLGAKVMSKFINPTEFRRGAMDAIVMKFVWTEGIAKSQWGVQQFGTGDIYSDPSDGQLWWDKDGRQVAMQGLTKASALDGLVDASPMDGVGDGYGHLLPPGVSDQTAATGAYTQSGYVDPYHAAVAA